MDLNTEYLWTQKYRPRKIDDCILPDDLKETFKEFVRQGNVPNMLLAGGAGTGKTTVALAMLDELGCDSMMINASMNGNIDTLRNEIKSYASTISMTGGRKYVILDEADHLNPQSTQPSLRNFIEEYSKGCGFIMTCNFKNRIIEPLHSRCTVIDFKFKKSELPSLAKQFMKRVVYILDAEGIDYELSVVAEVIKKYMPDWRRTINELQRYSASGKIDSGILSNVKEVSIKTLAGFLKDKDFTAMRKWVAENSDGDSTALFRSIYDHIHEHVTKMSVPAIVMILAKYQYQSAFVADHEINIASCLTEIMIEAEWL